MPLELIDLTSSPGSLVQRCAACGAQHTIRLDRGAAETTQGPFALSAGDALQVSVDGKAPVAVALGAMTRAADLRDELSSKLSDATVALNDDAVLIESNSTGPGSRVEIVGGTAQSKLGLGETDWRDAAAGRPILGVSIGQLVNSDAILLRRCGCSAQETLIRTWDEVPSEVRGSSFDLHRRAVNGLAEHFIAQNWIHADASGAIRRDTPPDVTAVRAGERIDLG
jgi:hypothetical protein